MGDSNFLRYYISAQNGWNPLDEKIKKIPSIYWTMAYYMKEMEDHDTFKYRQKPLAELAASIIEPRNFSEYIKYTKEDKSDADLKSEFEKATKDGGSGAAVSDVHMEPGVGLVNNNTGKVVVSIETMKRSNPNASGIFAG